MNLIRINRPRSSFHEMQDDMNRFMTEFIDNFNMLEPTRNIAEYSLKPAIELNEKDGVYEIKAQLPGVDKDNIDLEVNNDSLTIKAETEEKKEEKGETTHRSEFRYGKILRTIQLPNEIDSSKTSAEYKNGVLTVTLPKTQEESKKGKKIEIKENE